MMTSDDILQFWFVENGPDEWFKKDDAFDALIRERFLATYEAVIADRCTDWRANPEGRLAEIIVLDQFSRNMFRGTPLAFGADDKALALAQEAVAKGADKQVDPERRVFFYMPFMHSESLDVHKEALPLFEELGNESTLSYEHAHREILERFGRYPHRNEVLGRESTPEEVEFLKTNDGF
jgi:uncharacterized protein (DUF924 family)